MLDIDYKKCPGRLSDKDITFLCIGDNPMISPFVGEQKGKPSFGLSSAGVDFRLGYKYLAQIPSAEFGFALDPLNCEHQELQWEEREAVDGIIIIPPLGCILTETVERVDMPDDVVAIVLGKSTYARSGLLVNATPIENGFRGIITLELYNCNRTYSIVLRAGQGIAQMIFDRMANKPARGYDTREVSATYQDQSGVTPSR